MIAAILQARMSSQRLPGKVLAPILGRPMILWQIERIKRATRISQLIVATSDQPTDDPLVEVLKAADVEVYRGSLNDVLARFVEAIPSGAAHAVRLTGDCPLIDPDIVDACIDLHVLSHADYTSNTLVRTFPDGLDVEVMTVAAIRQAARDAVEPYDREHVTPFVYHHPNQFHIAQYTQLRDQGAMRWTVDNPEDLEFVRGVFGAFANGDQHFGHDDILTYLDTTQGHRFAS